MKIDSKVLLNASLDAIVRGERVEQNVESAVEILSKFAVFADQTLFYMRDRPQSRFLREELSRDDLTNVGLYKSSREHKKDSKIIVFSKYDVSIRFVFKKSEYSHSESFQEMLKGEQSYSMDDMERMVQLSAGKIMHGVDVGSHPNEVLLGKQSRTLDSYELARVDVIRQVPDVILWCIPITRNVVERVYSTGTK